MQKIHFDYVNNDLKLSIEALENRKMMTAVKEEKLVFQYMKNSYLENSNDGYVKELEDEHDAAGNIIKEITACTNDFTAPEDGCASYRLVCQKLQELVKDVYIHIFTENSLLFQKYEGGIEQ